MQNMERGKDIGAVLNGKLRIEWDNNRIIFVGDEGVRRMLIGPRADGVLAAELSAEGVDVLEADDTELIWSSRFKSFTIAQEDTIQVTRAAGDNFGAQNLPTGVIGAAAFICYVRNVTLASDTKIQAPHSEFNVTSGVITKYNNAYYDPSSGEIWFNVVSTDVDAGNGSAETWEFSYFLLYQNIP